MSQFQVQFGHCQFNATAWQIVRGQRCFHHGTLLLDVPVIKIRGCTGQLPHVHDGTAGSPKPRKLLVWEGQYHVFDAEAAVLDRHEEQELTFTLGMYPDPSGVARFYNPVQSL